MATDVKYILFEGWLKSQGYKTGNSYLGYIRAVEKTLLVKDFDKITSPAVLKQLLKQIETNRSFAARSKTDRDNILSGFRAYIEFITDTYRK